MKSLVILASLMICLSGAYTTAMADEGSQIGKHGDEHAGKKGNHNTKLKQREEQQANKQTSSTLTQHTVGVQCGDILTEAGKYHLDTDLECTSSIQIKGSNVHLNMRGHSLTCIAESWQYPEPLGVPEEDRDVWIKGVNVNFNDFEDPSLEPVVHNVSITNGTIANCAQGISLYKTDRSRVARMNLTANVLDSSCCWARGLEVVQSNNNQIQHNTATNNSQGIALFFSTGNKLHKNDVVDNLQDGILLYESNGNKVTANQANANTYGIWIEGSSDNTVKGNKTMHNNQNGMILFGASNNNRVMGNEVSNNGSGISLAGLTVAGESIGIPIPADNLVKRNNAVANGDADLIEGYANFSDFTFSSFEIVPNSQCDNTWLNNNFETQIAALDCIN
jgi:parallel beta-helix repeat protein